MANKYKRIWTGQNYFLFGLPNKNICIPQTRPAGRVLPFLSILLKSVQNRHICEAILKGNDTHSKINFREWGTTSAAEGFADFGAAGTSYAVL